MFVNRAPPENMIRMIYMDCLLIMNSVSAGSSEAHFDCEPSRACAVRIALRIYQQAIRTGTIEKERQIKAEIQAAAAANSNGKGALMAFTE
jgi:hypothetical protein